VSNKAKSIVEGGLKLYNNLLVVNNLHLLEQKQFGTEIFHFPPLLSLHTPSMHY